MKFKMILIAVIAFTTNSAIATELEFVNTETINIEKVVEPKIKLKLFPGITRPAKKSLAMHMIEVPNENADILNLNSSLVGATNTLNSNKYFADIEITNNNLFELRF